MALGGHSSSSPGTSAMSTSTVQDGLSSTLASLLDPTASATSMSSSSDDDGGGSRGANYFFGFLITFVVLLLVFVGCGIGSRRRFIARRDATLVVGQPWGSPGIDSQLKRPTFYEETFVGRKGSEWRHITPLSVTMLLQQKEEFNEKSTFDLEAGLRSSSPPQSQRAATEESTESSWIPSRRRRKPTPPPETVPDEPEPEAIQVAFMIVMPSSAKDQLLAYDQAADEFHTRLPEYEIGIETLPWRKS